MLTDIADHEEMIAAHGSGRRAFGSGPECPHGTDSGESQGSDLRVEHEAVPRGGDTLFCYSIEFVEFLSAAYLPIPTAIPTFYANAGDDDGCGRKSNRCRQLGH